MDNVNETLRQSPTRRAPLATGWVLGLLCSGCIDYTAELPQVEFAGDLGLAGDQAASDAAWNDRGPAADLASMDRGGSDLAAPDMAAPDTAAPDTAAPDAAAPDMAAPDMAAPDMAAPDMAAPDMAAPDVAGPDMAVLDPLARPPDFNGDDLTDLVIGSPGTLADRGGVIVVLGRGEGEGRPSWPSVANGAELIAQNLSQLVAFGDARPEGGDRFGSAVATGDVDGDGCSDLVVGAPRETIQRQGTPLERHAGAITLLLSDECDDRGGSGLVNEDGQSHRNADYDLRNTGYEQPFVNARFGHALAMGDFDDERGQDVAVFAPGIPAIAIFPANPDGARLNAGTRFEDERWGRLILDDGEQVRGLTMHAAQLDDDEPDELLVGIAGRGVFVYGLGDHALSSMEGRSMLPHPQMLDGDSVEASEFGHAIAILEGPCQGRVVVGAPKGLCEDRLLEPRRGGRVYLYAYDGTAWRLTDTLEQPGNPDGCEESDHFGYALAAEPDGGFLATAPFEAVDGNRQLWIHRREMLDECRDSRAAETPLLVADGTGSEGDRLGGQIVVGDYNGDGRADVVASRPYRTVGGHENAGDVVVFLGGRGEEAGLESGTFDKATERLSFIDWNGRPPENREWEDLIDRELDDPQDDDHLGLCLE